MLFCEPQPPQLYDAIGARCVSDVRLPPAGGMTYSSPVAQPVAAISIASGDRHALPGVRRGADVEKIAVVRDLVGRAGRRRGRRARADQPAQIVERLWCRCDDPEVRAI